MNKLKEPKQERSRVLFQSILEATTQILNKVNDSKVTTRGIAERAGVSVGSLYQYFTGTDSILSEVLRDRVRRDTDEIWAVFQSTAGEPLEKRLETMFRRILEIHIPFGRFRTVLLQRALSLQQVEFVKIHVETLTQRMLLELKSKGQLRADLNEEMAIYLISRAGFSVVMSATIDHEEMAPKLDALARELARMLAAYVGPVSGI